MKSSWYWTNDRLPQSAADSPSTLQAPADCGKAMPIAVWVARQVDIVRPPHRLRIAVHRVIQARLRA